MPEQVVQGAQMMCSFGTEPAELGELPAIRLQAEGRLAANIEDCAPFVNVLPFGECTSLSNPAVASATAAAQGVLTPQPCMPAILGPWTPGEPRALISGMPALNRQSECRCAYIGQITIAQAGTTHTEIL